MKRWHALDLSVDRDRDALLTGGERGQLGREAGLR
jgi:hypothetical protein